MGTNRNQRSAALVEGLEDRRLLSGTVAVSVSGGTLTATGDNLGQRIQIQQLGGNKFRFLAQQGESINGATDITFNGVQSMVLNLSGGNDRVTLGGGSSPQFNLAGSLTTSLGSGNNQLLSAAGTTVNIGGSLSYTGTTGTDDVNLQDINVLTGSVNISAGDSQNSVSINDNTGIGRNIGGSFTYNGGNGLDTVVVEDTSIGGNFVANVGTNTVNNGISTVSLRAQVNSGTNDNNPGTSVGGNVTMTVNGGRADFGLNDQTTAGDSFFRVEGNVAFVNAGTERLTTSVGDEDDTTTNTFIGGTLQSVGNPGNGGVDFTLSEARVVGALTYSGSSVKDTVIVQDVEVGGTSRFTMFNGNDLLDIDNSGTEADASEFGGAFTVDQGSGKDTLNIQGTGRRTSFETSVNVTQGADNDTLVLGTSNGVNNDRIVFPSQQSSVFDGANGTDTRTVAANFPDFPPQFVNYEVFN